MIRISRVTVPWLKIIQYIYSNEVSSWHIWVSNSSDSRILNCKVKDVAWLLLIVLTLKSLWPSTPNWSAMTSTLLQATRSTLDKRIYGKNIQGVWVSIVNNSNLSNPVTTPLQIYNWREYTSKMGHLAGGEMPQHNNSFLNQKQKTCIAKTFTIQEKNAHIHRLKFHWQSKILNIKLQI